MVRDRVELFLTVADRTLGTATQRRSGACEYDRLTCYVDGLRDWMVGNQRWGVTSARYAARGAALDFVEDVTGALTRDGGEDG
jgi:hypothetical protein